MKTQFLIRSVTAAFEAGKILKQLYGRLDRVERKDSSFREIITEADRLAEKRIIKILRDSFPESAVWTEESSFIGDSENNLLWVVDPVDGTVNYVNGIPFCATSIACVKDKCLHSAIVYNPFTNEYFYAQDNLGSWLNEVSIKVSRATRVSESLLACAFSSRTTPGRDREYNAFGKLNDISRGCLRTGSAAVNLAYVACGKLSGTWGRHSKIWDVLAGLLIVCEAGGKVTVDKISWEQRNPTVSFIATNGHIHDELLEILSISLGEKYSKKI